MWQPHRGLCCVLKLHQPALSCLSALSPEYLSSLMCCESFANMVENGEKLCGCNNFIENEEEQSRVKT